MKPLSALLLALWLASLAAVHAAAPSAPAAKLNVVLFLIDDLGWRDIGANGSTYYRTPHIDALAREGVRFTDAYAASAARDRLRGVMDHVLRERSVVTPARAAPEGGEGTASRKKKKRQD